ncbi:MAG TPA: hypothetical protein VGF32_08970 [Streptosporangiaceae bacterium]
MSELGFDPVGQLLRDRAGSVSAEVGLPDWRGVIEQQARLRTRRLVRRASFAVTVMALAAALAVLLLPAFRAGQAAPLAGPHHVRFGHYHLMVRDLPAAARAPGVRLASQVMQRALPVRAVNQASVAFGHGSAWVLAAKTAARPCGGVIRVSTAKVAAMASLPVKLCPNAVSYGAGSVWVLSSQAGVAGYHLAQVNPDTLATTWTTTIDGGRRGVTPTAGTGAASALTAATSHSLYVAVPHQDGGAQISVLDTSDRRVTSMITIPAGDGQVTALGASETTLWAGTANGWVLGLDPATSAIRAAHRLGTRVVSLAAAATGVWVSVNLPVPEHAPYPGLDVLRLDPVSGALTRDTGLPMAQVATDGSSVWALGSAAPYESEAGLVAMLNPATGDIVRRARLAAPGYWASSILGVSGGHAWVVNGFLGSVARITP